MSGAPVKIISGGQTGADRAALDFALARGMPHGGWCPKGRLAEDGPIPPHYQLTETAQAEYDQRTDWNVRDSDATVIFSSTSELTGGSRTTAERAGRHRKPLLHLVQGKGVEPPERALIEFIHTHRIRVLNVAGPRASQEPGIAAFVTDTLRRAFDLATEIDPAKPVTLETARLRLRPLRLEDAPAIVSLAGRREVADTTLSVPHPYSEKQAREWIALRTGRTGEGNETAFAMALRQNGQIVGAIGMRDIDFAHWQAELGFWVGVEHWSQGYATEAVGALLRFAFEQLNLNRVHAHYMVRNPASGRVLEKVGMKREGVLRQRVRKWGVFEDVVVCALLRAEWLNQSNRST